MKTTPLVALLVLTLTLALGCIAPARPRPDDGPHHPDVLTEMLSHYFDWAGGVAPEHVSFLMRALLLYGLPTVFCGWAFARGNRSTLMQAICFAAGILLAATIPVDHATITNRFVRGWFILLSVVLLAFLPAIFPRVVAPQLGIQKKLQVIGYLLLIGFFILNLFQPHF